MAESQTMSVIDFDSHVVEPAAVWQDYLQPEYRVLARSVFWRETDDVGTQTILNGELLRESPSGWLQRAATWRPGLTWDAIGQMSREEVRQVNPGAQDPQVRLRDMDAIGVDKAVLFPTYFGEYFPVVKTPDVAAALARAYNDWLADFCAAAPDRLLPAAVLPLQSPNFAVAELRRTAEKGFKVAMLRPANHGQRFLNHPAYDPLWRELEERGVVAAVHAYPGTDNPEWFSHGPFIEKVAKRAIHAPVGHPIAEVVAPILDNSTFLVAEMFYAFLERFPKLRVALLHGKASWLPLMLEKVEGYATLAVGTAIPIRTDADEVFYEHGGAMIGFDADELVVQRESDLFENVVVWGSRYPNHDAMSAQEAIERLTKAGLPETTIARMMSGNAAKLLDLVPAAVTRS